MSAKGHSQHGQGGRKHGGSFGRADNGAERYCQIQSLRQPFQPDGIIDRDEA